MTVHLNSEQVQDWIAGKIPDELVEEVERHLDTCEQCARLFDLFDPVNDAFVARIRDIHDSAPPSEAAVASTAVAFDAEAAANRTLVDDDDTQSAAWGRCDRNLLFGLLAMQSSVIDVAQFVNACTLWATWENVDLDAVLVSQGWLSEADRSMVQKLLQRKLEKRSSAPVPGCEAAADRRVLPGPGPDEVARDTQVPRVSKTVSLESPSQPRLELGKIHATGGIGRIRLAHDQVLNREIAYKELLPAFADSDVHRARFFREAQITAQLTHPGAVPVYDYVDDGERQFYTMKFVEGRTLTEVIAGYHDATNEDDSSIAGLNRLLNHFVSVCNTIAYAHSKHIIHRDLKSDNVIVGDFGEVIVLDWGLAKRLDEKTTFDDSSGVRTIQGERLGTPAFMAPEQAEGRVDLIDFRTDVYGLAGILYEILTGQPAFSGKTVARVLVDVVEKPPVPPSERCPHVRSDLAAICLRGLAKKREDRQQSVEEFGRQIEHWLFQQTERKRTEQVRERFFGLSLDMLAILGFDAVFRETNPAWERVLGWTPDELAGRIFWDLVHPDHHENVGANLERLMQGKPVLAIEHLCLCKDGSSKYVSWNASLLAEEQAIYIVGRDITNLKRAAE